MRLEVAEYLAQVKNAIRIPKGTAGFPCRGATCVNRSIYMVPPDSVGGKPRPVSLEPYGTALAGIPPTETEDGAGISHFADCPDADHYKRKGKK